MQLSTGASQWDTPIHAAPTGPTPQATPQGAEHPYGLPGENGNGGEQHQQHGNGSGAHGQAAEMGGDGTRGFGGENNAGGDGERGIGVCFILLPFHCFITYFVVQSTNLTYYDSHSSQTNI